MRRIDFAAIIIGDRRDRRWRPLRKALLDRTRALGQAGERFHVLTHGQLNALGRDTRAVAAVLCRPRMSRQERDAIDECLTRNIPIFPVVRDLTKFSSVAPASVSALNGYELTDPRDVGELAGLLLEALGLQRGKRKIFISYARMDSSEIALQLRAAFTARWYTVFLDTVSIRPGAEFQDELMQELADSDVVVLLNSPSIKKRPYVMKEIAFADQAGVGGVEVTWPEVNPLREGAFFKPVPLDDRLARRKGRRVTRLTPAGITRIVRAVADMRTELQQRREAQLLGPVKAYAKGKAWRAVSYLGRYIELRRGENRIRLDLALGVPTSRDLERAFRNAPKKRGRGRLIYDPLGITNSQADHLGFLGSRLGLQFLNPRDTLPWTLVP